jgi:SAM-dependent methyltransferase
MFEPISDSLMKAQRAARSGWWRPRSLAPALAMAIAMALGAAGALAQDEVPFVTSPEPVTLAMLKLARVGPRDVVLDLGSGDGRIVITAAKRFGASGLGVELSPQLVQQSQENAWRAGVAERALFRVQDLFETDLSVASVITMYLLPEVNLQLRPKLLALKPGTRIVSHDWDLGDWHPDRSIVVDAPGKTVGLYKKSRVHLWTVPAQVGGHWCAGATSLRLEQQFQMLRVELIHGAARQSVAARIEGTLVPIEWRDSRLELSLHDGRLRVDSASGAWAALRGALFVRSEAERCT